jgi:hypothetical protein
MAARLELYAGDGTDETALVGFVSASDEDEERLAALIDDTAGRSALDARTHGTGRIAAEAVTSLAGELAELTGEVTERLERDWAGALRRAADILAARGAGLTWRMRYDRGGSIDDGADEFATAWSPTAD